MENTITLERDLVTRGGHILGRLERWDIPAVLGRRCHSCDRLIPVPNWEVHQYTCHTIGWGHYHSPIARFTPRVGKSRAPKVDWVAELAQFLK